MRIALNTLLLGCPNARRTISLLWKKFPVSAWILLLMTCRLSSLVSSACNFKRLRLSRLHRLVGMSVALVAITHTSTFTLRPPYMPGFRQSRESASWSLVFESYHSWRAAPPELPKELRGPPSPRLAAGAVKDPCAAAYQKFRAT